MSGCVLFRKGLRFVRAYPNGVAPSSPGLVGIGDLPWVEKKMNDLYPNGVAPFAPPSGRNPVGVGIAFRII